jgi:ADP-ribose pyrophosphatase YjhB (NUDIX family)
MNDSVAETAVSIRCSVAVWSPGRRALLLVRRQGPDPTSALPGGTPEPGEGLLACGRREVSEETGLQVMPTRCLLIAEAVNVEGALRVEVVLDSEPGSAQGELEQHEGALLPLWVDLTDLGTARLTPPIAGHLRGLARARVPDSIPMLGNLWRPHLGTQSDTPPETSPPSTGRVQVRR